MLTEQERCEIHKLMRHFPKKQAASLEALKVIQKSRGWVTDENLKAVSEILDMSPEELDGIATFYNLIFRRPVGRHVILICDSVSCWIRGSEHILEHLVSRLGGIGLGDTTEDNRFTLLPVSCLGVCEHAPALMIDDDWYGDLTPEKIDQILEQYE
jgi:NADH-quinone oxidoreductase subunit E